MQRFRTSLLKTVAIIASVISGCALPLPSSDAMGSPTARGWNLATPPSPTGSWFAVDYGDNKWVALGDAADVAVSPNGSDWTEYPTPAGYWHAVTYGDGHFVALSSVNADVEEMVSTDGVNWNVVAAPVGAWTGLTFGGGLFVAVSSSGEIITSPDGEHWTQRWNHSNYDLTSVTYGSGHYVATDASLGALVVSASGLIWSRYLFPQSGLNWSAVTYGNGNFVALTGAGLRYEATSVFGSVWTLRQHSPLTTRAATFGCGDFVAVAQPANGVGTFLTSSTGATWAATTPPVLPASLWTAVAYGNQRFVAVSSTGNIVWSNSDADCAASIPTAPLQVSGNIRNGQVWTYMHPSSDPGGSPITGYRVTISNSSLTKECRAADSFQPNCIISGLSDGQVYWVTAQAHNRFGYSVTTDPVFVIPVSSWTFSARTAQPVIALAAPVVVQVTGVVANSQGIYPTSVITVHFGTRVSYCHANPYGECLVTIANAATGLTPIYATYTGYGRSHRSPTSYVTIVS